jgi:hypothetical protein
MSSQVKQKCSPKILEDQVQNEIIYMYINLSFGLLNPQYGLGFRTWILDPDFGPGFWTQILDPDFGPGFWTRVAAIFCLNFFLKAANFCELIWIIFDHFDHFGQ